MAHLIDVDKIRAEIERRKMESIGFRNNEKREDWASFFNGEATALENLLSFISALEPEKPRQEELEEEIERYLPKIPENPYNEELRVFARHFAEWGAEHRGSSEILNDLEKAARMAAIPTEIIDLDEERLYEYPYLPIAEQKFKEGAEWASGQMMKEAVEGEIHGDIRSQEEKPYQIWAESDFLPLGEKFEIGDKVYVIIVKKENE